MKWKTPKIRLEMLKLKSICVSKNYMNRFKAVHPDRHEAMLLAQDGYSGREIAERIGRSYMAARKFLSECRKVFEPFAVFCKELLEV